MDVTWNSLENFGTNENALVVVDGSGSMYGGGQPMPMAVALSLGIYFAERNTGVFHNHFITFSARPQLVELKGRDIAEKVRYCAEYNEVANTNLQAVFEVIIKTAVKHAVPQEDMPKKIQTWNLIAVSIMPISPTSHMHRSCSRNTDISYRILCFGMLPAEISSSLLQ